MVSQPARSDFANPTALGRPRLRPAPISGSGVDVLALAGELAAKMIWPSGDQLTGCKGKPLGQRCALRRGSSTSDDARYPKPWDIPD
jgi:hypothetical protein